MDTETNERLRRLSRYGDDLGAALEVLRESERRGWTDAPLLDFGSGDRERLVDKAALDMLRCGEPCWVEFGFEEHGIVYRPPHLSHVGRKEVVLYSTQHLSEAAQGPVVGFKQGVVLQFINIKAWFLALSVVSGWVIGYDNTLERLFEALPIFMFFGLTSNLTYAWIGASLRHWLRGPNETARRLQWFNRGMAVALLGTVMWMVQSAFKPI